MRRVRIKDEALEQRMFFQRVLLAAALVTLIAIALVGRAFWLQVVQHAHYVELSQGNRARIEPLPPNRGVIYDRAGRVIAENTPAYQLELIREQAGDLEDTLARLVRFGLLEPGDVGRVRQLVLSRRTFEAVPFLLQLDDEEVARYAVHRHELPGVLLETRMARHYPYGTVGAHALGYVGTISEPDLVRVDRERYFGTGVIGKTGIERAYEAELLGTGGYREVLVNAEGRPARLAEGADPQLRTHEPQAGRDLRLTIDIELQRVAEEAFAGRRGGVVAIDPTNGDVLVFASLPSFDPNGFARGISRSEYLALTENPDQPLFNRVLRGTYPPGSTIKPLMALAGLENDVDPARRPRLLPGQLLAAGLAPPLTATSKREGPRVDRHAAARSCSPATCTSTGSRTRSASSASTTRCRAWASASRPASTSPASAAASCPRRPGRRPHSRRASSRSGSRARP